MAAIAPAGIITHLNDYLSSTAKRAAAVEAQGRAAGRSTGAIGVGGRNHAATLWPRPLPRTFAPACKIPRFLGAYLSHNARPRASNSPPPEYRKPPRNGRNHAGKATAAPGWNHTHLNDYFSYTAKRTAAVEAQSKAAGLYNQIILLPLYCQEVIKTPKATPQKPRALGWFSCLFWLSRQNHANNRKGNFQVANY